MPKLMGFSRSHRSNSISSGRYAAECFMKSGHAPPAFAERPCGLHSGAAEGRRAPRHPSHESVRGARIEEIARLHDSSRRWPDRL